MTFFSVNQYLALLENISILMCQLSSNVSSRHIIFLAAAVSDFYLPEEDIRTHKIQSHPHEPLTITLKPVEKVLQKLVKNWCPDAFVVSFKVTKILISSLLNYSSLLWLYLPS